MKFRFRIIFFVILFFALPVPSSFPQERTLSPERKVIYIFDGDTVMLDRRERVRLIGIDTMEIHDGEKLTRQARIFHLKENQIKKQGKKSKKIVEKLLKERRVRLSPGLETHDDYGRTLAYVYFTLPEDKFAKIVGQKYTGPKPAQEKEYMLDRVLVQYGWAEALTHYPFDYLEEFVGLQRQAKENRWGMWKSLIKEPSPKN
jgi:endonuclease YncB( thermonuclease family)